MTMIAWFVVEEIPGNSGFVFVAGPFATEQQANDAETEVVLSTGWPAPIFVRRLGLPVEKTVPCTGCPDCMPHEEP